MNKHTWLALARDATHVKTITTNDSSKDGIVIVRLLAAGICGTDIDILRSARSDKAEIIGHEGLGEVVEILDNNNSVFKVGDLVTFNPVNPLDQFEILGHSKNGIFQEYYVVNNNEINSGLLLRLPQKLPLDKSILIEPLATAIYGQGLVDGLVEQKNIVIIGAGPIGLINALYAKSKGLRVVLVDRMSDRLQFAVNNAIVKPQNILLADDSLSILLEKKHSIDAVYLCTNREGALDALAKAVHYVRPNGCINLVGGIKDGDSIPEILLSDLNEVRRANICGSLIDEGGRLIKTQLGKEIYLTGHRGTSHAHLLSAINHLSGSNSEYTKVLTHSAGFGEAGKLLDNLIKDRYNVNGKLYIKGMITF